VKRVYVAPHARGRGFARTLVRALEERAAALGWTRLVLEAGLQQPEAIGLYLSLGYVPVERYGEWADVADSRCFAKPVLAGGGGAGASGAVASASSASAGSGPGPVVGPDPVPAAIPGPAPVVVPGRAPVVVPDSGRAPVVVPDPDRAPVVVPDPGRAPVVVPDPGRAPVVVPDPGRAPVVVTTVDASALPGAPLADGDVLVAVLARRDDRPAGWAALAPAPLPPPGADAPDAGELRGPVVALEPGEPGGPELRGPVVASGAPGAGVATALLRAVEAEARARRLRTLVTVADVRDLAALDGYRALGFRPVLPFGPGQDDPHRLYLGRTL